MPFHNRLVLLVEDEAEDAFLVERFLSQANPLNRVQTVANGEDALDYLKGRGRFAGRDKTVLPCLVLLDLKMPGMSGFEVLEKIRGDESTKSLPVAVITASAREKDRIEAKNLGADKVLQKAADFADFSRAIQALGLYWLVFREPLPEGPGSGKLSPP